MELTNACQVGTLNVGGLNNSLHVSGWPGKHGLQRGDQSKDIKTSPVIQPFLRACVDPADLCPPTVLEGVPAIITTWTCLTQPLLTSDMLVRVLPEIVEQMGNENMRNWNPSVWLQKLYFWARTAGSETKANHKLSSPGSLPPYSG